MKRRLLSAVLYLAIAATATAATPAITWTSHNGKVHVVVTGCDPNDSLVHVVVTRVSDNQLQDESDYVLTAGAADFVESIYSGAFTITAGATTITVTLP